MATICFTTENGEVEKEFMVLGLTNNTVTVELEPDVFVRFSAVDGRCFADGFDCKLKLASPETSK
jgi:hypothetical protein